MDYVFDNIIFSKEKQGGISNYWYQVTRDLAKKGNVHFYEEKGAGENIFRQKLAVADILSHFQLPVAASRLLPIKFSINSDLVLYHSSFYRAAVCNAPLCEVTTVHDFLHHKHSPFINRTIHNGLKFGTIKRSKGIICVSNNTYSDLKHYTSLKDRQQVAVIYNGVSNDYKPLCIENTENAFLQNVGVTDKFILFVGARSSYKNFDLVLEVLAQLPDYKLVLVGNNFADKEKAAIDPALLQRIIVAQSISNSQLNVLYNTAHVLLYPSSYEGFGIPVVEAMKAGCPVLALHMTAIPEIAGGAALLMEQLHASDFVKGIRQLENQEFRSEIIERGLKNATRFNWEKCRLETTSFYEEVIKQF